MWVKKTCPQKTAEGTALPRTGLIFAVRDGDSMGGTDAGRKKCGPANRGRDH